MKKMPLLIFVLLPLVSLAQVRSLKEIRQLFLQAGKNSEAANAFKNALEWVGEQNDATFIGYKGMSVLMLCNYSINPFTKMKYFIQGKELLESAIEKDIKNVELRFLRYTVQDNVPVFLGYNSKLKEDKAMVKKALTEKKELLEHDLFKMIMDYFAN